MNNNIYNLIVIVAKRQKGNQMTKEEVLLALNQVEDELDLLRGIIISKRTELERLKEDINNWVLLFEKKKLDYMSLCDKA